MYLPGKATLWVRKPQGLTRASPPQIPILLPMAMDPEEKISPRYLRILWEGEQGDRVMERWEQEQESPIPP